MIVLYFSRDYTPHDHRFLSALAKTEHKVYYLRLERRGHSQEDRPLPPEVEGVSWAGGQEPYHPQDTPRLFFDLQRVIAEIRPDLIQAGPIQTCALLAAMTGFHPLVATSWGSDLLVDADGSPWSRWATRAVLSRSDVLVGDCQAVRQKAVAYGMHPERVVTFPWGVDLEHFNLPPEPPGSHETFTLLSVRSWEPIYGVDVLAQGFVQANRILQEQGYSGLRLILLGSGSQAARLHEIFHQGGVEEQVFFPGQVSQAALTRYYRQADLYVSASHSDGTSISLLEALACGRPVLVSDIPGNREWITPGQEGWWFPDGDATALAAAIVQAVGERRRLGDIGRAARHLAERRADWRKNFPELLRAYEMGRQLVQTSQSI